MLKTSIVVLALAASQLAIAGGDLYPTAACIDDLSRDARLKLIDGKVAPGLDDELASVSTIRRVATLKEREVLGVWSALRAECFALGAAHRGAAHVALPALANRLFAMQQELVGELRDGRIGYAEFNARRMELRKLERRQQDALLDPDKLHTPALR